MKKILLTLVIGSLLFGCSIPIEIVPTDIPKGGIAVKDLKAKKYVKNLPIVFNSQYLVPNWAQAGNTSGDFAMGGAYYNGKVYLGGYGSGKLYSVNPLKLELNDTGEAVLAVVNFNNAVYATSENNDMAGQHTRVFKYDGSWKEIGIDGYAAYFMTVWNNNLVVTSTRNLSSIDVNIGNGSSFSRMATFSDWLWVPVVYKNELYILGHGGGPDGPGYSKAVKWNGSSFVDVPALCNSSIIEWQSGVEHNGYLYLGSGGWTMARGSSKAAVYRFDGVNLIEVKTDPGYHEVQCLLSSRGSLYATFGQGFKYDNGGSKIWAMNGNSWREFGTFPCPQLYVIVEIPEGQLAAGGRQGNLNYFYNIFAPKGGTK